MKCVQMQLVLTDSNSSTYGVGKAWEHKFAELARERGLHVNHMGPTCVYDLSINGFRVQCKSTNFVDHCGSDGRIRISRGSGCSARNNYKSDEFDIFAINHRQETFIVPVSVVGSIDGVMLRRLRTSILRKYKDNWSLFEGMNEGHAQQMELF